MEMCHIHIACKHTYTHTKIITINAHLRSKGSSITHFCIKSSYVRGSYIIQNDIIQIPCDTCITTNPIQYVQFNDT